MLFKDYERTDRRTTTDGVITIAHGSGELKKVMILDVCHYSLKKKM